MIGADEVRELIMKSRKAHIKEIHPYALTPPKEEGGRWQTFIRDTDGKRKNIRAGSEEELLEKLIPCYFAKTHIDNMTFSDLFEEWLQYKESFASPNTLKRHRQHFKKYFEDTAIPKRKIRSFDIITLEEECNRIVRKHNLTRKEWVNVKTILNGSFEYAVRKSYLTANPVASLKILTKFRQVNKKTGKTETFNSEEREELFSYLKKLYAETGDAALIAIRLNFYLGLRIGELVALKWDDYCSINQLHIVREEIRNQETGEVVVIDHTKTNSDRFVTLVPQAIHLIQSIPHEGDFIFMRDGKRITARQAEYVLDKYAERQGLKIKSSHKIRKTYASMLNAAGVPLDEIREQLGHTNLNTTLGYIYNPLTAKETYQLMSKAL